MRILKTFLICCHKDSYHINIFLHWCLICAVLLCVKTSWLTNQWFNLHMQKIFKGLAQAAYSQNIFLITFDVEVLQKFNLQFWKLDEIVHSMKKPLDEKPLRWKGHLMKRHSTVVIKILTTEKIQILQLFFS